jgi:hypothetical protein
LRHRAGGSNAADIRTEVKTSGVRTNDIKIPGGASAAGKTPTINAPAIRTPNVKIRPPDVRVNVRVPNIDVRVR